jgi:hypothetical protein
MHFLGKGIIKLFSNFTWRQACFVSSEWCEGCWTFIIWITIFSVTGVGHCFGASCNVQRRIQDKYASCLVPLDRYTFYLAPCVVWRWVTHLGFEKQGNSAQTSTTGNRKVSKKVQAARPLYFKTRSCQNLCAWQSVKTWRTSACPKHIPKSRVMELVSITFYWLNETIVKLYVGLAME